ncbi:CoA-binding protein [Candidatus Woesearchaeota archaeon]|nr:MAG: CoA-binding protein [Candidatus Woesearchaeota archaeon]
MHPDQDLKHFLDKKNIYAVIGATPNKEKYGYKVFHTLKQAGYLAIPVNPNAPDVDGIPAYKTLKDYPGTIDVVVFVVPPPIALDVLHQAAKQGIRKAWFQPGSESAEALSFCKKQGIDAIHGMCIMVESTTA